MVHNPMSERGRATILEFGCSPKQLETSSNWSGATHTQIRGLQYISIPRPYLPTLKEEKEEKKSRPVSWDQVDMRKSNLPPYASIEC